MSRPVGLLAALLLGLLAGSASASPSPTPTTTSPTTTATTTPPAAAVLGVMVAPLPAGETATTGSPAAFAVQVWATLAGAQGVTVAATDPGATWPVCPLAGGTVCTVGALPVGPPLSLEATVPTSAAGTASLAVTVTAPGATGAQGSGSVPVTDPPSPTVDSLPGVPVLPGTVALPGAAGALPGVAAPGDVPGVSDPTPTPSPGTEPVALPRPLARLAASSGGPNLAGLGASLVGAGLLGVALALGLVRWSRRRPAAANGEPTGEEVTTDGDTTGDD